jgi:hypothetical protein
LLSLSAFSEEFAEETGLLWVIGMALASILLRHPFKGDFDMLATA